MSEEEVQYVKLVSSEGHEFILDRSIAVAYSKTIAMMLEGSFLEAQENVIRFPEMAGFILERLVKYLHYKAQYSNSSSRIPDFVSSNSTVRLGCGSIVAAVEG
jgi:elongin-C